MSPTGPHRPGELNRRRLLGLVGTGLAGGLAGCSVGESGDDADGGQTDDGIPESGAALEDSSVVLGHGFPYVTEEYELNPWAPGYVGGFPSLVFAYPAVQSPDGTWRTTGLVDSVDVESSTATISYSDEYTWWNGEPVTARDRWVAHRIDEAIGVETDGASFELLDEYTIRYRFESPRRRSLVLADVLDHVHGTPAWFYGEWAERLEAASTESERVEVRDALQSTSVSLSDAAERGIGCGPYELREVSPNRLLLDRYEDHPNADALSIPRLWFPSARDMRAEELTNDGVLDLGQQVLHTGDRPVNTPPHVEQLDERLTQYGTTLLVNWQADHLDSRAVRRAMAAVLPLDRIERDAGWGQAARRQTGLSPVVERRWLDESLRERLDTYPVERDDEVAAEFMRRGGYRRDGGTWVDDGGNAVQIGFQSPLWDEWSMAARTIETAFSEFGFDVSADLFSEASYLGRVGNGRYQLAQWETTGTPFAAYDVSATSFGSLGYGTTDAEQESVSGRPVAPTIPTTPGALDIDDGGTTVNLVELWRALQGPTSAERTREIVGRFARWWNYDLPHVQLATRSTGIWGNTRDFEWPEAGSDAYRTAGPSDRTDYYLLRAGAIEPAD